jgi:hypothetical protein
MLSFVAIGLDHTTAGIELRERLAFAERSVNVQSGVALESAQFAAQPRWGSDRVFARRPKPGLS